MAGDKTAVECGLAKREPIGHSKTSVNPHSVHCIRSSNKNEEQEFSTRMAEQNNVNLISQDKHPILC